MHSRFSCFLIGTICFASSFVSGQRPQPPNNGGDFSTVTEPMTKVPTGVILVKGAWSSASDTVTPIPEGGSVTNNVFNSDYLGCTTACRRGGAGEVGRTTSSDSGRYVLAQIRPADTHQGRSEGAF